MRIVKYILGGNHMSILILIEEALRRDLASADHAQQVIDNAKKGGPEFCVSCWKTLGYPALSTHVHDPKRWKDGAYYTEGAGQTCAECAAKERQTSKGC